MGKGALYKYHIVSKYDDYRVDKADPFAFSCEGPPRTASIVWDLDYAWGDGDWMARRRRAQRPGRRPSPSTRSTWAPGGGCRRRATAS